MAMRFEYSEEKHPGKILLKADNRGHTDIKLRERGTKKSTGIYRRGVKLVKKKQGRS
jgi:hypothetical protein